MPPTSSCSRRQPRWDSRPSNNRHARPRRMPEARLTMKFVRACSKMLRPSVTQVKSTLPPIKTILIAKSDLLAELSASSLKRAGVCGTFRKHALFLKIDIDFVRKTSDSARRPRGEIRKTAFSVRNTYVRCG